MKKFLSLLLSIGLVIGMVPMNVMAQNGPCQDEYPPAYIEFFDGENGTYIYSTFSQDQIGKIKGVSYDKASNTLTLDNVKRDEKLITNVMGDDFKILLKGDNSLKSIIVWGDGYGGNLTITGHGKLTLNSEKTENMAITIQAEYTEGKVKIEKNVQMEMYAKEGYPIIEIVGANNSDKDKAVVIDGKVTQNYEVEQHITEVTNNVYVVAKDSTARCYFTKFEKNGKYYGGRSKFDDNFKLTGRYDMFEIIEDEELGYVARQIEDQSNIVPEENGYTIVMKDEYNEDSFTDTLELDKWKYSYEIYTYDGKEYGVLEMTVTSNGVTRHFFTVVKFIDFEDYGKIAIPIEGWEELDALPEGFVRKTSDPYNLYGYTIMQQTLNINRDNSNPGTTEPGTTEPGGNNSGVNNPGTNNSDAKNPGTNNSGANNSGTNNASTIKPGAENNLVPGKAKAPAVKKAKKKSVKLVWRKIKNAKKYQVQYYLNKKFKKGKKYGTKTLTTANIKITIKKLNKKTYYVRIRGINGKNIGKWSKVKKITMKK